MIVTTTEYIPGYEVVEILGIVIGNTVKARHVGKDIMASLRSLVGGEIKEYTEMLSEARKVALNRMIEKAKELGADAIINVRLTTSETMEGVAELIAYGTAVKLRARY